MKETPPTTHYYILIAGQTLSISNLVMWRRTRRTRWRWRRWKRTSILGMVITENASAEINQCPVTRKNLPQPEACPSVNVWRAMLNRTAMDTIHIHIGQQWTGTKI